MEVRCEAEGADAFRRRVRALPAVAERESFPIGMVRDRDFAAARWGLQFDGALVI